MTVVEGDAYNGEDVARAIAEDGDLADELGISQQALSNRIRRGSKQVLETVLL